jgi:hypothetical protein
MLHSPVVADRSESTGDEVASPPAFEMPDLRGDQRILADLAITGYIPHEAVEGVITGDNALHVRTSLVVEGTNGLAAKRNEAGDLGRRGPCRRFGEPFDPVDRRLHVLTIHRVA